MEEFKKEWFKEDMPGIPMLDDRLVEAEVGGKTFKGGIVLDVMNVIAFTYGWKF